MRSCLHRLVLGLAVLGGVALAGCGAEEDVPAPQTVASGGACFASCGGGLSVCWSGDGMTESECRDRASGMCGEPSVVFKQDCECPDGPVTGPESCP